ncbi:MAG TPA: hypothetical protein VK604_19880 [Bryobacteraceae bacterium]|nr:hypothetical protein [Bryobacteraceae bacterium]
MSVRVNQFDQMAAVTKVIEVAPHVIAFKVHVRQIVESPAFRGSRRSQEFLQFIVDHALNGHFDELKERSLGVELFGREPSYDTGDDSIVRVTACDLRKRLTQFYAESDSDSGLRVDLRPGSYIPEFRNMVTPLSAGAASEVANEVRNSPRLPTIPARRTSRTRTLMALLLGLVVLTVALDLAHRFWWQRQLVLAHAVSPQALPWSALALSNRQIRLIFCDPDIVHIQRLLNYSVSLSDYANQRYWPKPAALKPEAQPVMRAISFRGADVAAVDVGIALGIASISGLGARFTMTTQTARSVRLADFRTDDSFVLLGSPRSNPWSQLFDDQLDFSFKFDALRKSEFILNKHPRAGESPVYLPTAEGWGTGQAYAVVALVSNPNQAGQVLLLGGSNAEATEAAGKLATNLELLPRILKSHGIEPSGSPRHFEILIRVSTMAGSSNSFDVIACHALV